MLLLQKYKNKRIAIYGMGKTGLSAAKTFQKMKAKLYCWDDNKNVRKKIKKLSFNVNKFWKENNLIDVILLSPGIDINKCRIKNFLKKNINKVITDLDLFFEFNKKATMISITGTNGKSTTCKILEYVLKKNGINIKLGGNIGKPILDLDLNGKPIAIIEASSFQLAHSKYVKPTYAAILNITKDHLDWHGSIKEYTNSKLKIFSNQNSNNFAFLNNKNLIKKFKKNKYKSKLKIVNNKKFKNFQKKIKNVYLRSEANTENMSYIFEFSKIFNIKENSIVESLVNFKGLNHRHEIFYKKNNKTFINDSKATTFEASKFALKSNQNIFWIVGGLPKLGDEFKINKVKKNITKAYIIGNYPKYFKKYLNGKINFELSGSLNSAIISIFRDIKNINEKKITILLSPASASYDQFRNFEERGNKYKKLIIKYAKRNF